MHLQLAKSVLFLTSIHPVCLASKRLPPALENKSTPKTHLSLLTCVLLPLLFLPSYFPPFSSWLWAASLFPFAVPYPWSHTQPQFQFWAVLSSTEPEEQYVDARYNSYEVHHPNIMKVQSSLAVKFCNFHVISRR